MKKVIYLFLRTIFILILVLYAKNMLAYSNGKEVMTDILNSTLDEKAPIPEFLKPVEKEFKDSNTKEKKYITTKEQVFDYVSKLPERSISSKSEALIVVSEINTKIKELNKAKVESDKASDLFESKAKNLSVGNQVIDQEFNKIFNDFVNSKLKYFENKEYGIVLETLYKTREFYSYISKTKSKFVFINGYPQFESSSDQYVYYVYIAKIRDLLKDKIKLQVELSEYFQTSQINSFIDSKFIEQQNLNIEINKNYISKWNAASSQVDPNLSWIQNNPSVNSTKNQSELETRRLNDLTLQSVVEEMKSSSEEYFNYGEYGKDRFSSKANLKKALELSKKRLSLYKRNDLADYLIRVQYQKDFPIKENIISDALMYSDVDFNNLYIYVQRNALYNESIELDIKLYNLAIANYNKYSTNFDPSNSGYKITFKSKSINTSYRKMIDDYYTRFAELFKYTEDYDKSQNKQSN